MDKTILVADANLPKEMTHKSKTLVIAIINAAKQTLSQTLNQQAKLIEVKKTPLEVFDIKWGFASKITANGDATIEAGFGIAEEKAAKIGLNRQKASAILNSMMSKFIDQVKNDFDLNKGEMKTAENSASLINKNAKECYSIHLRMSTKGAILRKAYGFSFTFSIN
ncbi:hypothetical protein JYT19_00530 [Sulfobacillus acidophilus]|uniref:Uncharacterized protein n=1 Tax=Sulfobacillus acidophilus TaxID=53633 RepID=A0ABS3AVI7_9FIRM|nr:hypothetical protein [Sulfobacillus acidophilus]